MKGIVWLASGLMLALLLVSGISVGSQFSLPNNLSTFQDAKSIGQISGQALDKVNQSLNTQTSVLNNSATVISTWDLVSGWFSPIINWFADTWASMTLSWGRFLGLSPKELQLSDITPAVKEQMKQELLIELKNQGIFNSPMSTSSEMAGTKYGIMVAPSTGSTTRDEWIKQSLSQMFADQVRLKFDQSGMSGLVTPTFRDGRQGSDYIFVLTPMQ